MLDLLPGLARLVSCGAGTEPFDIPALEARGIAFFPTPEAMTEDTAEMGLTLCLAVLRRVVANDAHVRSGIWATGRAPLGRRLAGRQVGIVGLGRIGKSLARRLDALGAGVAYSGPRERPVPWRYFATPAALADWAEVLVLTCPGGAATHHLVDAALLSVLGPDGMLINISRGSVVDEEALIAALVNGTIAGAGLDVFEAEPRPDPRFGQLPNVVLQPHAAVLTHEARADLVELVARRLDGK